MSFAVEFGSKDAADHAREEWSEYVCPLDDDKRKKEVYFVSDTPDSVRDMIEADALDSQGEQARSHTADLTDGEREKIKEVGGFDQKTTVLSWESAKGVFAREGLTDRFYDAIGALADHDDPAEGAEQWIADMRGHQQQNGSGPRGGARDHGEEDIKQQQQAAEAARAAKGGQCDHAREHCEHGDPEACEFLREACGYGEDEVAAILDGPDRRHEDDTEQRDLVTVGGEGEFPEMDVTPQEAGALRRSWKAYKAGTGQIEDALDTLREEIINSRQAVSTINAVREQNGQDEMHPNRLHDLIDSLIGMPQSIPEVRTLQHFADHDGDGHIESEEQARAEVEQRIGMENTPGERIEQDSWGVEDVHALVDVSEDTARFLADEFDSPGDVLNIDTNLDSLGETWTDYPNVGEARASEIKQAIPTFEQYYSPHVRQWNGLPDQVAASDHAEVEQRIGMENTPGRLHYPQKAGPWTGGGTPGDGGKWTSIGDHGQQSVSVRPENDGTWYVITPKDGDDLTDATEREALEHALDYMEQDADQSSGQPDTFADTSDQFAKERQGTLGGGATVNEDTQFTLTGEDADESTGPLPAGWERQGDTWRAGPYKVQLDSLDGKEWSVRLFGDGNRYDIATGIRDATAAERIAEEFTDLVAPDQVSFHSSDATVMEAAAEAKKAASRDSGGLSAFGGSGNADSPPVEVVMTVIGGGDTTQAVEDSAALVGFEATKTEPPTDEVEFVDYPFKPLGEGKITVEQADQAVIEAVEEYQPHIAVGPDINADRSLDEAVEVGDRLLDAGADHVVLTPKAVKPSEIPDRFRVGIPNASNYGDSDNPHFIGEFATEGVGDCHVLGGAPQSQLEIAEAGVEVRSVDGSSVESGAKKWKVWTPGGSPWWPYAGATSDLYERIEHSLDNVALAFAEHYGEDHPEVEEYHDPEERMKFRDVLVVDPETIREHEGVNGGGPITTRKCWRALVEAGVDEEIAKDVLREFDHVYSAAVYAESNDRPAENQRALRQQHVPEDRGGRLLNIDGLGPATYDKIAALSPTRLEHYPKDCDRIKYTKDGPESHIGEFTVECGDQNIVVSNDGGDQWSVGWEAADTGEYVGYKSGSRVYVTELAKVETLASEGLDPEEFMADGKPVEEIEDALDSPTSTGEQQASADGGTEMVPASADAEEIDLDGTPEMFYVKGATGGQPWLNGENVLLSAGVAWRNSGPAFNLTPPENPNAVFIDSGGFQATVHFGTEYPYGPEELFEYAEEVGADYVAGMDFACESAEALAEAYDDLSEHDIPPVEQRIERTIEKQVEQARVYEAGEWSFEFVPVVQGLRPEDYRYCARRLREENIARPFMAIGTVCKRSSVDGILDVLEVCEAELPATEFHLFGATKEVWKDRRFDGRFASADTHAWAMKNDDGSWVSSKEEKEQAFESYREDIERERQRIMQQDSLDGLAADRSAFAAMLEDGAFEIECACGCEIGAYGTDFEPQCRSCERIKLDREMRDIHAIDTAPDPEETHDEHTEQTEL